jgi:putative restriction endonuclease
MYASRVKGRRWTEPELVRALALYFQIPFGSIDQRNLAIIALASELDRTPGSVGLKLANFASLDPFIVSSGRVGMQNASNEDRRIFDAYVGQWELLADHLSHGVADAIERRRAGTRSVLRDAPAVALPDIVRERATESIAEVHLRRGQGFFRNAILSAYDDRCCITRLPVAELLRASHIIPWRDDPSSRLDPRNGLCLNALHDAAFDRGLITFDEDLRLVLSRDLTHRVPQDLFSGWFGRFEGEQLQLPGRFTPRPDALRYHREEVFVDS